LAITAAVIRPIANKLIKKQRKKSLVCYFYFKLGLSKYF
jgi:hypothetical protein